MGLLPKTSNQRSIIKYITRIFGVSSGYWPFYVEGILSALDFNEYSLLILIHKPAPFVLHNLVNRDGTLYNIETFFRYANQAALDAFLRAQLYRKE